jgi:hypothetical protein
MWTAARTGRLRANPTLEPLDSGKDALDLGDLRVTTANWNVIRHSAVPEESYLSLQFGKKNGPVVCAEAMVVQLLHEASSLPDFVV